MQDISSGTRFELRYRPTVQDYAALLRATKHTWTERLLGLIIPAAYWGVALILTVPFVFSRPVRRAIEPYLGSFSAPVIVLAFGALLYCFHTFVLLPRFLRDTLNGQIIGQGENEIAIDAQGIVSRVGSVRSEIPWDAVHRVADQHGCILLFTGRNSGLILPRRAFATPEEADRLLAFAQQNTGAPK